jgi:hypothetical protein
MEYIVFYTSKYSGLQNIAKTFASDKIKARKNVLEDYPALKVNKVFSKAELNLKDTDK